MASPTIESVLHEQRLFQPPTELAEKAAADPAAFWAELAEQELHWFKKWDQVLDWQPPFAKWFVGGKLNISYNCLDRHLTTWRRNKAALIWEGEPGDSRTLTYGELHREVCQMANVLKGLGVQKGDRVGLYMPMIPEAAIAMLACARIGAPHTVVFGGFSADALRDRLNDAEAKVVITADGGFRKDKVIPLKAAVDQALENNAVPSVRTCWWCSAPNRTSPWEAGRDHWWHDLKPTASGKCEAEEMDAEDMLFILYTSGTTGKPKGVVHTTGGYNLYTHMTFQWTFDHRDTDVYWCTADVGWITGHSYIVYGPSPTEPPASCTKGCPAPLTPAVSGMWWKNTASISSTPPPPPSVPSSKWAMRSPTPGISLPCGFWAPWVNPSTPKPGCGTTR
jgi:acetyl-CoA synthetase